MTNLPREYKEGMLFAHHEKGVFLNKKECLITMGILIDYLSRNGYKIEKKYDKI